MIPPIAQLRNRGARSDATVPEGPPSGAARPDLRLFAPALLGWAVTAAALARPGSGALLFWLGLGAGGGALALFFLCPAARSALRRAAGAGGVTLAVLVLLGFALRAGEAARSGPVFDAVLRGSGVAEFTLELTGYPRISERPGSALAWVSARSQTARPGDAAAEQALRVPLAVALSPEHAEGLGPGARLRVTGSARAAAPGDSAALLLQAERAEPERLPLGPAQGLAQRLRGTLARLAAAVPGDPGRLIPGLAVGDTRAVTPELDERMKRSSLTHLIAVSGSNCAVITGLVTGALRRLGVGGGLRLLAAAGSLLGFVLVTGPEPSVLRATVMAVVVLVGVFSGRKSAGLPALGVAVIALLAADPWQARSAGFALSVFATAGILLGAVPLARWLGRWLPGWFAPVVAVPVVAQLACQPLLILLEPSIPLPGIPANILAAPAAPAATVLGLLACLLGGVVPVLGEVAVWLAALPAAWIAGVAQQLGSLPGAQLPWPGGWPGALLLAAVEAAVLLGAALRRGRGSRGGGTRVLAAGLALGVAIALLPALSRLAGTGDWRIVACDVGQGDAVLVRGSGGVILIDVGDDAAALRRCLRETGVGRIDLLVLSHDHLDHIGALPEVADRVRAALIAPEPVGALVARGERPVAQTLRRAGVEPRIGGAGDAGTLGDLSWEILFPAGDRPPESVNAGSLVLRASAPGWELLALGDLGAPEQVRVRAELPAAAAGTVRVVKVAHHGSADQDPELYRRYAASLGLLSVGADNRYGHPRPEALRALAEAGTEPLRTDELGTVWLGREILGQGALGPGTPGAPGDARAARVWAGRGRLRGWQSQRKNNRHGRARAPKLRSWPGPRPGPRPWCSSPAPRRSSRTAPVARCATTCSPRTRPLRCLTWTRRATARGSCSRSRAPPCSGSRG